MLDGTTIFLLIRLSVLSLLLWLLYGVLRSCFFVIRGQEQRAKYLGTQLIIFAIAFILLWPATGIRLQQRYLERHHRPQLYAIAEKLGYTAEDFLVEDSTCWDTPITLPPLGTQSCSIFLYFTTDMAVADLKPLIAQFPADQILDVERNDTVASAFSLLNLHTSSSMTSSENQEIARNGSKTEIHNYQWIFYQSDNSFQWIWLYETSNFVGLLFDGNPIEKNIILVDLGLGQVSFY